jgi:hypothetical protein
MRQRIWQQASAKDAERVVTSQCQGCSESQASQCKDEAYMMATSQCQRCRDDSNEPVPSKNDNSEFTESFCDLLLDTLSFYDNLAGDWCELAGPALQQVCCKHLGSRVFDACLLAKSMVGGSYSLTSGPAHPPPLLAIMSVSATLHSTTLHTKLHSPQSTLQTP